ncbi:MAG: folate family ECF transporter S component [Clostridiales bacterium]|jgi:ECF transporter S component (folate family)|nr:folate family ECF transporter S component [Clostridiales bacterium]
MNQSHPKRLAVTALLIAMEIVLSRFGSITTPIVKIGFEFLPVALTGMLYGPFYAGIAAAIADVLGASLFPAGAFFPGFTLTAFLTGAAYGVFLYGHERSLLRVCLAVGVVNIALNIGLNTAWLQMITGKGYIALLPARVTKNLLMAPIQASLIRLAASRKFFTVISRT